MKSSIVFKLAIICGCFSSFFCDTNFGYYWRDYTGDIPKDAVEGGLGTNNRKIYIGQVFLKNFGIIPVTIYPGKTTVTANIVKIYYLSGDIKILCSLSKEDFKWVPADAKTLHVKMINKHLVKGGVEWEGKVLHIGRILHQGEVLVAKICSYNIGDAKLFFPSGNEEKNTESYEVLVYEGPDVLCIVPTIV